MNKKLIRYFYDFIDTQQKWLNSMSEKGYRLVRTGNLTFEFEECEPNKYKYCVEFVAHKSNSEMKAYKRFLEEIGYNVMTKNINLNYSFCKLRLRPYGLGLGKIATSPGNYNKEILIVEKVNDGKPFELHTTTDDKIAYYNVRRNTYLSLFLLSVLIFIWNWISIGELASSSFIFLAFSCFALIPIISFQKRIQKYKKYSSINE